MHTPGEIHKPGCDMNEDGHTKKVLCWRAWMVTDKGGLIGLPYPANSQTNAERLAEKAAAIFGCTLRYLEPLGMIDVDYGDTEPVTGTTHHG